MKKTKEIYELPKVKVIRVVMEKNIAQVPVSVHIAVDPWVEDPIPVGDDPETEGGDFYVFY